MKILKFEELNFNSYSSQNESKKSIKSKFSNSTDEDFRKFVYDRLKLKFPDNFNEDKAEEVVTGLLKIVGGTDENRNYAQAFGMASHI